MELKNKKLVTQDKQDNQQLQLNLIIQTFQQKDEFIPLIKNYLTEKINFWKTTLKGYKKLDDFSSQVIQLALKGEQLKQQIVTFYTLPQNQALLEDNFLFLKIYSIFFSLVTNEQRKCFKMEQQLQEMLNRYGGISHLISIINVNSDIIKNTVCYLTISIVQDRGRIINQLTPKMASFFSYQFQDFSSIKYIQELMPEQISAVHNRFIDNFLDKGTSNLVDSFSTLAIRTQNGFIQQARIYLQAPHPSFNDFIINGSLQKLEDDQQKLVIINSIGQIVGITEALFKSIFCYALNQVKASKHSQEIIELFELKQLMGINFFLFFPQLIKQITSEIAQICKGDNNNNNATTTTTINGEDKNKINQDQQLDLNQIISNQTGIIYVPSQIFEIQKIAERQISNLSQISQFSNSFSSQLELLNQLNTFISQSKENWEQDQQLIQSQITFSVSKKRLSILQNNVHLFENFYFIDINQENIVQAPLNVITQKTTQIMKNISAKLNEKMNKIFQEDESFRDNLSSPLIKILRQNSLSTQNNSPELNYFFNSTSYGLKDLNLDTSQQDQINENQDEISDDCINRTSNNDNKTNNIINQIKILDKNLFQENAQSQIISPPTIKIQDNSNIDIFSSQNQPNAQNIIYSNQSNALLQILSPNSQEQTQNFIFNENNQNSNSNNQNRLSLYYSNSNRQSSVNHFQNQLETHMNMQKDKEDMNASNNKNIVDFFQSNKKIGEEEINCGQSSTQDMQSIKHSVHNIVSQIINKQDIKISKIINSLLYIILIVFSFYSLIYGMIMFDTLQSVKQSIIDVTTYQNLNNVYANQTLNSVLLYQFEKGILVPNSPINQNLKQNSFEYIYDSCSNCTDSYASDIQSFSSILYSDFQDVIQITLYPNKIPFQIEANYVETIFYNQINVIDLCLNSTFNFGEIEQESVLYLASNYYNNQIQVQNYTQKLVKKIKTQYDIFNKLYLMFAIIVAGTFLTMFVLFIHYFKQINKYKSKVLLLLARTNIDEAAFEIQKLSESLELLDSQLESWVQNSFFSILSKASLKQYDNQKIQTTQSKRQSEKHSKSVKSFGQISEKLSRKSKFQIKNIFSKLSKKLNMNGFANFLKFNKQAQNANNSALNKFGGQKYVSALIQNHSLSIVRQVLIISFFCVSGSIFFITIVTTNYLKTKEIEPLYHLFDQSIQNTQSLCSVITLGYLLVTNKINQLNNTSYPNILSNSTISYFNNQIDLVQMSINQFSATITGTSFSSQSQSYCNQILEIFEQDLCQLQPLSISCEDLNSPFRKVIQNGLSGIITSYTQLYFQNIFLDLNMQNLANSLSKDDIIKQNNYFITNPSFINLIFYGYDIPLYYTMKISLLISEAVTNQTSYIRNLIFIYFFSVGIILGLIWLLFSIKVRNKFNDELKSINFSLTLLPYQKCQEEATIYILKSIQKI
ncbi:transmembrane protein, putative (macronuclear) [Tetrahymena thermophila SB210]|uniref:Transmembrane protein, putative n=1 Tax=Tetrahymena thermophila (strain SB210) TaxID=312017 RepID=I7LTY9_TETTS|nr:transmembrane protein, putative [Tetrahymena thermophila SB210]EAR87548.2 transmembrane protein, putative [Tetrahymena thermophila SB210]|eukprot:XP_001007793.2 transmembrane protein, putative [Tetrahymena thermophila SB210]